MSTLPHGIVIFPGFDERALGIDIPFIENRVDYDGEEIAKSRDDGIIGVEDGEFVVVGGHRRR